MRKLRSASLTGTSIDKHGAKAKTEDGSEKCCGENGTSRFADFVFHLRSGCREDFSAVQPRAELFCDRSVRLRRPPPEVGLLIGAVEKRRDVKAHLPRQSVLSSPGSSRNYLEYGHISDICAQARPDFLCSSDCVAEGEGFEPSAQVLARTAV